MLKMCGHMVLKAHRARRCLWRAQKHSNKSFSLDLRLLTGSAVVHLCASDRVFHGGCAVSFMTDRASGKSIWGLTVANSTVLVGAKAS